MSNSKFMGGKTLDQIREDMMESHRTRVAATKLLREQQQARAEAEGKAAEKPPEVQAAEMIAKLRERIGKIQTGSPYAFDQTLGVLTGMLDVLDYLLGEQNQQQEGG